MEIRESINTVLINWSAPAEPIGEVVWHDLHEVIIDKETNSIVYTVHNIKGDIIFKIANNKRII